ncbi:sodium:proton antiporter [Enterovirga aerilata]|uniref:Sodium:proton antiporter n=1 Tax=Enterovirga aerilata TaxID=2730920 RepID=A0A849IDI6_9HYPH|nr:sodium:proton antiporter [Enterovirga sp. DB1703]NNM74499.1 sodium:proton antiporter [Enterovirga sp. DB1703]
MGAKLWAAAVAAAALSAGPAEAAEAIDGRTLGLVWAVPFAGILLSIAILPQLAHRFWDRHMGALSAFWALLVLAPLALTRGFMPTLDVVAHVLLTEYLPFILLLFALYTIAGGLVVVGNLHGSPRLNTGLLAFGTVLASFVGTTGASMVLIRPLLRANDNRRHNVHVVVFFIFLVSNIGGALTPLGDPPLFLGFLRGVDFFWTTRALAAETLFTAGILLAIFYAVDRYWYRREGVVQPDPTADDDKFRIRGGVNLLLLAALVGVIILSGVWKPGVALRVLSVELQLQNLVRDGAMVVLAGLSLLLTSRRNRAANDFNWRPIIEVAKIFAGIFVCLVPVAAALGAGRDGAFAPLLSLVSRADGSPNEAAYFWLTGLLSSFLDNAPTYLVFFELAGGDPVRLMGPLAGTLAAISTGAVFMGANSYIGNAPNFMVYAIARGGGVRMPSFFGYMLWSGGILLPLFVLVTFVFFW